MASPPNRTDLAGTPTVATYKIAIGLLYDYVASLLGNGTATIATSAEQVKARESLGVGSFGFKNRFINPEFSINQRNGGSSIAVTTAGPFVSDRWYAASAGANVTAQRITGIANNEYSLRFTGASSNTLAYLAQRIESINCADLKNKNITISFNAKASSTRTITWEVFYFNVKDNASSTTSIASGSVEINTSVGKYEFTLNAGSNAGNGLLVVFGTGALPVSSTVDFDAMQLEQSSIATEFEKRNLTHELNLCKRYYQVIDPLVMMFPWASGSQILRHSVQFAIEMRATPTITMGTKISGAGSLTATSITSLGVIFAGTGSIQDVVSYSNTIANAEI